jgi:hypothetical protein
MESKTSVIGEFLEASGLPLAGFSPTAIPIPCDLFAKRLAKDLAIIPAAQ